MTKINWCFITTWLVVQGLTRKLFAYCKVIFQQNLANVAGYHSYLNKQKPNSKQFRESISLKVSLTGINNKVFFS